MNHKEEELFLLGLILQTAVEKFDEEPETFERWEWLINTLEKAASSNPDTASFAPFIRRILPDPRIPF